MRGERPLHLDVGVPSGNAFEAQSDTPGQADTRSQQQLADQAQTLRDLLQQQRNVPATAPVTSPFDLFTPSQRPVAEPGPSAMLEKTLDQMASRLLVGDGSNGRRGGQLPQAAALLPGVVVDIFEEAGRLLTQFTCSNESARKRLCAGAAWMATSLAQRLQQDVRVQVQTDDPEDRCLLQVDADR